ncbi:putative RNA-directed DNA polymerase from transposon BS [Trichonephila clavipes]|nr:putative RNA-directed DNA polymerase from transposon BS [Trichonephila clavipes]
MIQVESRNTPGICSESHSLHLVRVWYGRSYLQKVRGWKSDADISLLENSGKSFLVDLRNFPESHKLCFNTLMSSTSFFTTYRRLYKYQPKIFLGGSPLSVDNHTKYLGFVLDPEISSSRHVDHLMYKSRKRQNILKYISGRDWGTNSFTIRNTYLALIRPILEYGYPIYYCATKTNLQKLERVQLNTARILTGIRNRQLFQ